MLFKRMMPAIACFAIAVLILVFAEGNRRIYSGLFFAVLGFVLLRSVRRGESSSEPEQ